MKRVLAVSIMLTLFRIQGGAGAMSMCFANPGAYSSIVPAGVCFLSEGASSGDTAARKGDKECVLLPAPQRVDYPGGVLKLEPERFIFLDPNCSARLLGVGRAVRESLAQVGPKWELTAARGREQERIGAEITINPSAAPRAQGYRLTIGAGGIRVAAHDLAGAFYAARTLEQICRQRGGEGELTCVRIDDWPDFANRGVLLDISRDKVPTMQTLYGLVELLSQWKINQLQLYMEHTFAYRNHRVVWDKASPMTGEQIMDLDAYCRERFVELVPNQNSFAHMERWFKHKEYVHLAEREDRPFSISPAVPGSIELIGELYDELLPHFSSGQFNVGCDETFDLGLGKSKQMCESLGKGRVYLDFLKKINERVKKRGKVMQFWGDIILRHPELIGELPDGIIAMVWGYGAAHPFAGQCPKFAASKVPFYVCPGTSTWNSIAGRTDNALANLRSAAESGLAHGALGYLNTNWGDNGHWQPLPVCYPGFAYGAAVSWAAERNGDIDLPRALGVHAFEDGAGVMGRLAYDLGNAYEKPGVLLGNQSVLFYILLNPECAVDRGPYARLSIESLEGTRRYIDEVMRPLSKSRMGRRDGRQITDEMSSAAALLRHACSLAIARLRAADGKIANIGGGVRAELAADLRKIISEHKRLWLLRNREGGLSDSAARMERLLRLYEAK